MSLLGKILLGLVIIAGGAFVYLSVRTLATQKSWGDAYNTQTDEIERLKGGIVELQTKIEETTTELQNRLYGWGQVWPEVQVVTVDGESGRAEVDFGREVRLGSDRLLYVFKPLDEGAMYLGGFRVQQVLESRALLVPEETKTPSEIEAMLGADTWRLRTFIPVAMRTRLQDQRHAMAVKVDEKNLAQSNAGTKQDTAEKAAAQQAFREQEVATLLRELADSESERAEALAEQARLSAELAERIARRDQLLEENRKLVARLAELEGLAVTPAGDAAAAGP